MENLIRIAIVMEMLAVNLHAVDRCSTRKHSRFTCAAVLIGFTVVLTAFTHSLWEYMGFAQGNAAFALIGVVYLLPLSFLYREPVRRLLSILFSAWIYTMVIYCLSVHLAYFLPVSRLIANTLLIQTLLYAASLYVFLRWIRKGFLFLLNNITQSNRYLLQIISLSWFLSIILVNANLIYTTSQPLKLISIVTLAGNAVLSYLLIYSIAVGKVEVKSLESIVYIDNLTKLENRAKLFQDLSVLIERKAPFRLFFIDLNCFKQINDQYGHLVGDQYLVRFSCDTRALLRPNEALYRMSGDEFIIVSRARDTRPLMERLGRYPPSLSGMDIPFLGLSMGWADYPQEETTLDKLVSLADRRMYQNKHESIR